jgi:ABC-2 type transport system ATP-binding protein
VGGRNSELDFAIVQERLEQIAGVAAVVVKESRNNRGMFEIESEKNFVRGDLARVVVESGWDLNELRPTAMSLEEIFLQLTGDEAAVQTEKPVQTEKAAARETSS